ncbi:SHOCT domain-containing protein [Halostella salina]|uniref:SHOCT domain-containing protein n=1 Tax=Halostella salina TaxID=1547897 RepID=UPI000EF77526|nr:SHOCT domain-containing protein [Halostella salina]
MSVRSAVEAVVNPGTMSILVLGAGILAGSFDHPQTGLIFAFGFAVLVPLSAILHGRLFEADDEDWSWDDGSSESDESTTEVDESAALETLRERYARGEIDELEYERRLEDLLETESVGEAREYVRDRRPGQSAGGSEPARDADRETERDRT